MYRKRSSIFTGECFGSYMFEKTANKVAPGAVLHQSHKTLVDCQVSGYNSNINSFNSIEFSSTDLV